MWLKYITTWYAFYQRLSRQLCFALRTHGSLVLAALVLYTAWVPTAFTTSRAASLHSFTTSLFYCHFSSTSRNTPWNSFYNVYTLLSSPLVFASKIRPDKLKIVVKIYAILLLRYGKTMFFTLVTLPLNYHVSKASSRRKLFRMRKKEVTLL